MEGSAIELLDPLPLARQILRFIPVSSSEDSAGVVAVNPQFNYAVPIPLMISHISSIHRDVIDSLGRYIEPVEPSIPPQPYAEVEIAGIVFLSENGVKYQIEACQRRFANHIEPVLDVSVVDVNTGNQVVRDLEYGHDPVTLMSRTQGCSECKQGNCAQDIGHDDLPLPFPFKKIAICLSNVHACACRQGCMDEKGCRAGGRYSSGRTFHPVSGEST